MVRKSARSALSVVWFAVVALSAGCGALDNMDFQGTYALESVNGQKLPATIASAMGNTSIKAGSITLKYGGTFVSELQTEESGVQSGNLEFGGTYEVIPLGRAVRRFEEAPPLKIELTSKDGSVSKSQLEFKKLTVERDGVSYVYRMTKNEERTTPERSEVVR